MKGVEGGKGDNAEYHTREISASRNVRSLSTLVVLCMYVVPIAIYACKYNIYICYDAFVRV
jgi:hypothetical protein